MRSLSPSVRPQFRVIVHSIVMLAWVLASFSGAAAAPAAGPGVDPASASCWCDVNQCTSTDGKSFSENWNYYPWGDSHGDCVAKCTSAAASYVSTWANENGVCGTLTCSGNAHKGTHSKTDIGPFVATRTCQKPACANPVEVVNITKTSGQGVAIASEVPTGVVPTASFNETQKDRGFAHTMYWEAPKNCKTPTGTATVVLKALLNKDDAAGVDDNFNDAVGIGLPGNGTGEHYSIASNTAGQTHTITFDLTPAIIASGHVTIWAQDDHSVQSINVTIKCCASGGGSESCCPPGTADDVSSRFHVNQPTVSSDYTMTYAPSSTYDNLLQLYLNYVAAVTATTSAPIASMDAYYDIFDLTDNVWLAPGAVTYVPGGTSPLPYGPFFVIPNTFNTTGHPLQVNHNYKVCRQIRLLDKNGKRVSYYDPTCKDRCFEYEIRYTANKSVKPGEPTGAVAIIRIEGQPDRTVPIDRTPSRSGRQ